MATKTVAIIGAGPGGLVAAKTLLQSDSFQVTIFEKSDRIGGIWSVTQTQDHRDGIIPSNMPTNLSRFAVAFSDLDWLSVEMPGKKPIHMHPKAWQVNLYLEQYAKRYVPRAALKLSTEVTSIRRDEKGGWNIQSNGKGASTGEIEHFDYCILASGFYSRPQPLNCQLDGLDTSLVKLVHSSKYRGLSDVLPKGSSHGKKILVMGGGNSGGEAAAAVAFDLSNKQFSSEGTEHGYEIVHILPQPVYGLPLFVPSADMPGSFVPLDVRLYDFDKRKDAPLTFKTARYVDDSKKFLHGFLQNMLGSDRYERGFHVDLSKTHALEGLRNPKAAIQDDWASYVRSGAIKLQEGRVTNLQSQGSGSISATIQSTTNPGSTTTIDDIAGVVYATGYSPESALRILDPSVLSALSYDPAYPRLPLLLPEDSLASSPFVPDLGFVGCYEGPYWGVMEMQARRLTRRWISTPLPSHPPPKPQLSTLTQTRIEALLDIRDALRSAPDLVPQYIFSDYMAIMEEATRDLALTRFNPTFGSGSITPAYYLADKDNQHEASKTRSDFQSTILAAHNEGRFVLHAVFRGLLGRWSLSRTLRSSHPDLPSGTVEGEMWFYPRTPGTLPASGSGSEAADREYLCLESGTWTTETGLTMPVYKGVAWRFTEMPERLAVWFLQPDNRSLDRVYHDLRLVVPDDPKDRLQDGKVTWKARAEHWCDPDTYVTEYTFVFDGVALEEFSVVHRVTGPRKDYVSTTRCTRFITHDGE